MTKVLATIACLVLLLPEPSRAWEPISEIGDYERALIYQASRRHPESVLRQAETFSTRRGIVMVRFLNGDIGVFASNESTMARGGRLGSSQAESLDSPQDRTSIVTIENEFKRIWDQYSDVNHITPEELDKADRLVEEFIEKTTGSNDRDRFVSWIALRGGNRYLSLMTPLLSLLKPKRQADFWETYIGSHYARREDRPTKEQIRAAGREMLAAIEKHAVENPAEVLTVVFGSLAELEKADIELWRKIRDTTWKINAQVEAQKNPPDSLLP